MKNLKFKKLITKEKNQFHKLNHNYKSVNKVNFKIPSPIWLAPLSPILFELILWNIYFCVYKFNLNLVFND